MLPVVRSAVRRWKRLHEQNMMEKLVGMRNEKKNNTKHSRDDARKMARKIPTEILAKQWLNDNEATLEVRAYLVDKVLPTLILGVEKLLTEADKKALTEENVCFPLPGVTDCLPPPALVGVVMVTLFVGLPARPEPGLEAITSTKCYQS
jgi:hypothetical protein